MDLFHVDILKTTATGLCSLIGLHGMEELNAPRGVLHLLSIALLDMHP